MPTVEVVQALAAPIDEVWALICDVRAYPRLMEPVRALDVVDDNGDQITTAWEIELKGSILKWTEHEQRDAENYTISYHQLDGDLQEFDGFWRLRALSATTTEATLLVRFEIGIPMLREMLNPVAERAIRKNSREMLLSLGPAVETP